MRRRLVRATARVPKPALDHQSVVLTARRCVSWSSHAVCGALSGGESELSLSVATHEGFRGWTTVPARGQCRETLGDLQGIVRKKTRVPQRTTEPASEQIVHDGARLARIKPRRRHHAAPRPVRQCAGVGGSFFCRWRHRPRLQCCPRYLWPTRHNFRHSDAPPPLQQRRSTPTAPSDGSQSPDRARQAREPSEERRLPARWGRRGARHRRFENSPFLRILLFDACVVAVAPLPVSLAKLSMCRPS